MLAVAPRFQVESHQSKKLVSRPTNAREELVMEKWVCPVCGYIYDPAKGDPDAGIAPGTPFEKLPLDWVCPVCGASREDFEKTTD
jgi:rubredoxin